MAIGAPGAALLSLGQERFEEVEWGVQLAGRVQQRLTRIVTQGLLTVREQARSRKTLALLGDTRPRGWDCYTQGSENPDVPRVGWFRRERTRLGMMAVNTKTRKVG